MAKTKLIGNKMKFREGRLKRGKPRRSKMNKYGRRRSGRKS